MLSHCSLNGGNPSFGNLGELPLSSPATSLSSPWFNDELLLQKPAPIVHFSRILQCHSSICVAPFLLGHPESEVFYRSNLNLGQIWWLEHFPRVTTLVFIWPGRVMTCLAHLAGGPIVIDSFSARLSFLPRGNCKTYSTSYSRWILRDSKVWSSPEGHVNAVSKHVCDTLIFNKNIRSPMLNVSCSIIRTPLYG